MELIELGSSRTDQGPPRFLHAADLHLGSSDHNKQAFENLLRTALDSRVDFVVLAGDVYDSAERSAYLQKRLVDGLERLSDSGIHVFIAHGNHDPIAADFRPAVGTMPERTHVFEPGDPQSYRLQLGPTKVAVTGVSFATRHDKENLAARIAATSVDADLRVAVVHANLAGQTGHDPYAPCAESDLLSSDIHYWALGHIHLRQVRSMGPGRWWAYPGNLQGRSTKPAECGAKGVLLVDGAVGGFAEPRFVPCDVHRFARLDVSLEGVDHYGDAEELLLERLSSVLEENGGRSIDARITVTGQTDAHDQIRADLNEDVLNELLPGSSIKVERVTHATQRPVDRDHLALGEDLVGALLRRLDDLRNPDAADELSGLILQNRATAGKQALELVERQIRLGELDPLDVLDQVEALVLEKLVVKE